MPDDSIQVILLGQGYSLHTDKNGGQRGTKMYHEAAFHPNPGSDAVSLPSIGDPFSDDAPDCLVTDIDMTYLQDNTNCGRIWSITYQNDITEPDITAQNPNEEDLQTSIDIGCEQVSFEPPANTWKWWDTSGSIAKQPIFFRVSTAIIKIYRTIWNNKLDDFIKINFQTVGKINKNLFYGIPNCMCLYEGANLQESRDETGTRIWKAEMVFNFRTVTGNFIMGTEDGTDSGDDGWNWVLRLNMDMANTPWGKPYRATALPPPNSNAFLYKTADFSKLLTAAGKPVKFPDLNWMD